MLLAYSADLTEPLPAASTEATELAEELASIRGSGIARGTEARDETIAVLAAPGFWSSGRIAAAPGAYGKHGHLARPEIGTALRRIAMQARPMIQASWNELTAAVEPAIPEPRQR